MDAFIIRRREGSGSAPAASGQQTTQARGSSSSTPGPEKRKHVVVENLDEDEDLKAALKASAEEAMLSKETTDTLPAPKRRLTTAPLAERMRPSTVGSMIGHETLLGKDCLLRRLLEMDSIPNMILWGPPGCGKTTLAKAVAASSPKSSFLQISAVGAGVQAVREVVDKARGNRSFGRQTILFVDEIHRFNKAQQDSFLPHVESGLITLIGATTENPSFELNSALLSRCRVFVLDKLSQSALESILRHALTADTVLAVTPYAISDETLSFIATMADGDARLALNTLELATQVAVPDQHRVAHVELHAVKEALQKTHLRYDKNGEHYYTMISALHKSIRGSDPNAAIYWLVRMLTAGEDRKKIARRLIRVASEDIGLADPTCLPQAVAAFQAFEIVGVPEGDLALVQCVAVLARANKSNALEVAQHAVQNYLKENPDDPVPVYLRNATTGLMKSLGYGEDYKYNPDHGYKTGRELGQEYLPPAVVGQQFLRFGSPP